MRNKLQKCLTLLLCLVVGIGGVNANRLNGSFKNGGTWHLDSDTGVLEIDAETIPDFKESKRVALGANVKLPNGQTAQEWKLITTAPWSGYPDWWIKTIKFSSNVKKIGKFAFAGLDGVRTVEFAEGTKDIDLGSNSFEACYNLVSFDFSRVTEIRDETFSHCYNLKNPKCPKLVGIGDDSFDHCISLGKLYLPGNSTVVGLSHIGNIPGRVDFNYTTSGDTYMWYSAGCKFVVNPSRLADYQSLYSNMWSKFSAGDENWYLTTNDGVLTLTSYYNGIPDFAAETGQPWWSLHSRIRFVVIEGAVDSYNFKIGSNAFKGAANLQFVQFLGAGNIYSFTVGESAFDGCSNFWKFYGGEEQFISSIGKNAFRNTQFSSLNLQKAITIGEEAFKGTTVRNLTLGSIENIGQNAFQNAFVDGGDIYVFTSVPTTSNSAFSGADVNNTTLHVSGDIVSGYLAAAPWKTFQLDKTTAFPVSGTWGVGYGQWKITADGTLTISTTNDIYDSRIPDYTNINDQPWATFSDFIRSVVLSDQIKGIGKNAFAFAEKGQSSIHSVEAPAVTSIGDNAFKNNDALVSFIGEKVQSI